MRNRRCRDPVRALELLQILLFAVAHFLGRIHHDGGKTHSLGRGPGREPGVRKKDLAILAAVYARVAKTNRRTISTGVPGVSNEARRMEQSSASKVISIPERTVAARTMGMR